MDRLDERADDVVVLVALPVIAQQRPVDGLRDVVRRDVRQRVAVRLGIRLSIALLHRDIALLRQGDARGGLERRERPSCVARGELDERALRVGVE